MVRYNLDIIFGLYMKRYVNNVNMKIMRRDITSMIMFVKYNDNEVEKYNGHDYICDK